ncbi:PQQ-dependent sugar dehydrogenase [Microbacterium sp. LTA6]|uniref:PQQ-dependent sugar dehydrogenase n=1 Tax=Microbacterium sp. LTA6 TaxID=3129771 RepID=UPI003254B4DC
MPGLKRGMLSLFVVSAVLLTACTQPVLSGNPGSSPSPGPTRSSPGPIDTGEPTVIASGLDAPWSVVFAGDTALISERDTAIVRELLADGSTREVGTVGGVTARGEGGLLGLAVHDDTSLYVYSTGSDGNRIQRFRLTGEPGSLSIGAVETIIDGLPSAGNHNGGRIAFGPDGMLYATTGDAGDPDSAQDRDSLGGKILRLTPDGTIPADNPFPDSPVYSFGHRNPQGIAWSEDGTMYASEFGQDTWDELNVIAAGENYGWPEVEGIAGAPDYVDPVQQWAPADASPSGIAIRGGMLYIANLRGERLRVVPLDDPSTSSEILVGTHGRLRDVLETPDGALWVLTNNTDGRGDPGEDDDRLLQLD